MRDYYTIISSIAGLLLLVSANRATAQTHLFYMDSATGVAVGSTISLSHYYDNNSADPVIAYSWGICYGDPAIATATTVVEGPDSTGGGGIADFFFPEFTAAGWNISVITEFIGTSFLAPGSVGSEVVVTTYDINASGTTPLNYCATIGTPPTPIEVGTIGATLLPADSIDGEISTLASPTLLARGDVDGNGSVVGLLDSLALLNYQFNGAATPPCLDAADCDGNGVLSGLIDALYLLNFQFAGGSPPPAPGTSCGIAPAYPLGCVASACP